MSEPTDPCRRVRNAAPRSRPTTRSLPHRPGASPGSRTRARSPARTGSRDLEARRGRALPEAVRRRGVRNLRAGPRSSGAAALGRDRIPAVPGVCPVRRTRDDVLGFFDFEASDLRNAGLVGLTAQSITASGNQPLWSQLLTLIVVVWAMLLAARSLVKALRLTHAVAWDLERRPLKDTTKTALWVLAVAALALMATGVARQLRQNSRTRSGWSPRFCVRHLSGDVVGRVEDSATTRRDQLDHDAPGIGAVRARRASVPACRRVLDRASDRQRSGSLRGARARDRPARRCTPPDRGG